MKNNIKVLTGYTKLKDADAHTTAESIITGCSGNAAFNFMKNELTNLVSQKADYVDKLSHVKSGSNQDIVLKKESKANLIVALRVICTEINHQQAGNMVALLSSGAPLWANAYQKKDGENPSAVGLKAVAGVKATELKVKVKKNPTFLDYGTVFAYILALNAVDDISLWNQMFETGHSATLTGLLPASKYLVSAAYKGRKGTALIWCSPVIVYTLAG